MKTLIRKMGNSQGVLIPKPFLAQAGMGVGEVEIEVEHDAIVIRLPQRMPRQGWGAAGKKLSDAGDDLLVWPEFANDGDKDLAW